jgi:ABC-2 type transport system ATP-binding protein
MPPSGDDMLFELSGVTKTYGAVTALDDLSVRVPRGAIGLLGPNGSGKTTMIRTLLGLIKTDAGTGRVLGMDVQSRRLDIRGQIGFSPEDECLFPGVAGIEFVAYAGELVGMRSKDAMQRAHEVLDYAGLGEVRYRKVESYSSGMKQRLKLSAAIVHDPKLLILDEPTNGMDPAGREDMLRLAHDLAHHKNISVLFSSHLLPDVEAVCDHIVVMGGGKLLVQGDIGTLKQAHNRCFEVRLKSGSKDFSGQIASLGCVVQQHGEMLLVEIPDGSSPELLWRAAAMHQQQIRHLRPQRSTLEEVFLKAVEGR